MAPLNKLAGLWQGHIDYNSTKKVQMTKLWPLVNPDPHGPGHWTVRERVSAETPWKAMVQNQTSKLAQVNCCFYLFKFNNKIDRNMLVKLQG